MWRAASVAIALTFFSSVASAQQCTTDARRVVDELYRHMLERGADAGSQQWQNQLQSGRITVRDLVRAIAKSQEHNQRFVRRENGEEPPFIRSVGTLYRHILGRQPDSEGARANALALGRQGIGPVVDTIVDSAEYNQQYGNWGVPGSGGLSFCAPGNHQSASNTAAPAPASANTRFRAMDRNNDGSITQDEWQGSTQSFRTHDWNRDVCSRATRCRRAAAARAEQSRMRTSTAPNGSTISMPTTTDASSCASGMRATPLSMPSTATATTISAKQSWREVPAPFNVSVRGR